MKLLDIVRHWLSQAEISAWEDLALEMEKRRRDKEGDLRTHVEAQGWRLQMGAEPFVALTSELEIRPVCGNRFEKRKPGGQWVRANPMRDFPQSDLVPLQRVGSLFLELARLQLEAGELPAAIEDLKREYQRNMDAVRTASPAMLQEALEKLRRFYDDQKEALPLAPRRELLEMEFTTLLRAFRAADSTQESEALRGQLRDFCRKHGEPGADRWAEAFAREEHQREYRGRLEEMRQAPSQEEIARNKAQILAFTNKYGNYLPGNPLPEIQAAWTHALENNIPPATPSGLRASFGREEGINLSWNNSPGATQYHAYRSESDAPESKSFLDSIAAAAAVSSPNPAFLDSSAVAGRDYFYWVKATNPKGESDFAGPAKGSRLEPTGLSREPSPQTAPPEVTARMMKAMEEGDILEAIEIYTLNLAHAETWVGMLDETLVICLENARGRKESADAPGIAEMQRNHKAVQKKLRELIKSDGNPTRIRTLTRISARNNDFVADLDEHLTNLNREKAESKARAGAEAKSAGDSNRPAEDKAGADAGAAAGAGVVEGQRRREQALAEIKARCDKVETWDDINAIRDSLVFYPELSQNEKLLGECHEMLNTAGNRVQAAARSGEIPRKTPAEGLAPPARANAPPDLNRIERRMREQPGAPPVPDLALKKPSSGFVTESWRRADPGAGTLARWAGVREEQYVNLAIVFTDIIGSTMLNSRIGDASWDEIRSAHFRQARRLVAGMNGWYIKDVGDAVLAVFKNAVDALSFAMELEKNTGHELVRITAGAHIGTVIIRGDDIFGNEVNLAARIQDKANPGEVWMSEGVRSEWRSRHGRKSLAFVKHSNVELKGLDEPITLWSVEPTFPTTPSGAGGAETKLFPSQTRLERERAKSEAEEIQRQSVLNRATAAAIAGHPDEVRDLIQLHPEMREVLEQHLKRAEQIKKESEEAETRFQSLLSRAAAAAAAGKSQEVRQLIKSHPERREALEPFLRQAEKVNEAERRFQIALSRAAAAAAAGNPEEVLALIQTHPDRREALEPLLRRAETFKEESKKPERQRQVVLERAAAAAFAGMTEEVRELMNSHPQWRQDLEPHLRRAEQVKKEGEAALGHIRHLQAVLTRATAAAAAGKTEEVRILMEQHEPFREQLIPHLHQAIQVQLQARAKEAATSEDIEALKGLLQTHKSALKSQPMLVKALESSLAETEARVHAEIKIKLLEKKILAEARKRVAVANSDEDIQLLDHWVDEQIGRLPTQNPALASELRALVTQAQHTLPKAKTPAAQADLDGWKLLALVRSQAKKFADEGDLDGVRSLITANPQWEPQLVPFMQEAAGTQIKTQASRAATPADVVALEKLIQKHRTLVDQNAEMAAEFDQTLQQARCAVKSRFKRRVLMWCLIFGVLAAAAGTIVFVLLSRKAPG